MNKYRLMNSRLKSLARLVRTPFFGGRIVP